MKQRNKKEEKDKEKGKKQRLIHGMCILMFFSLAVWLVGYDIYAMAQNAHIRNKREKLQAIRTEAVSCVPPGLQYDKNGFPVAGVDAVFADMSRDGLIRKLCHKPEIMPEYQRLYEMNHDMAGWLSIAGTVIDYPVMQTPEDEDYYLATDFYGQPDKNGCLILDTDSRAGTGTKDCGYANGDVPSTNLIIHGHTMKSGEMFGRLKLYEDEKYGKRHRLICFDSLYEERVYELLAVFFSQVYYEKDKVFKYYIFFQADTEEEFDDWYTNIRAMSLYDTGVEAVFGDEFITLSCCSYHVEDGRFVVVGKRIK